MSQRHFILIWNTIIQIIKHRCIGWNSRNNSPWDKSAKMGGLITGRPTYLFYQIQPKKSIENVCDVRKSVFSTNTNPSIWIIFRLEIRKNWWYYIDTKRWYQCTGKNPGSWSKSNLLEIKSCFHKFLFWNLFLQIQKFRIYQKEIWKEKEKHNQINVRDLPYR